jgi:hypothetical protein
MLPLDLVPARHLTTKCGHPKRGESENRRVLTPPEFCGRPSVAGAGDRLFLRRGERSEERGEGGGEEETRRGGDEPRSSLPWANAHRVTLPASGCARVERGEEEKGERRRTLVTPSASGAALRPPSPSSPSGPSRPCDRPPSEASHGRVTWPPSGYARGEKGEEEKGERRRSRLPHQVQRFAVRVHPVHSVHPVHVTARRAKRAPTA